MKKVRQSEVALHAGVSVTTVSRVLNQSGYVAEDVRERVENAIVELGYTSAVRSSTQRRRVIGLILPCVLFNPYFEKLELCLQQACTQMGFGTVFAKAEQLTNAKLVSLVRELVGLNVCGIVVASFVDNHLEASSRDTLTACGVPIVFIERTADCYGFNRVIVDNKVGTYIATNHLIETGHKELLYITKSTKSEAEQDRLNGFMDAVAESGGQVHSTTRHCAEHSPKSAYEAVKYAYQENPSINGIVAWNDMLALGALLFVLEQGKRVPQDVEIIGYDDVLAADLYPEISSVRMPIEEMAYAAVEILKKNYESAHPPAVRAVSLEPQLILRQDNTD